MFSQDNVENDSEPWVYCSVCLSPKIKFEEALNTSCCCDCGSTTIIESIFEVWEDKYEKKYGCKYVNNSSNMYNSPIFQMTTSNLMLKVSKSPRWEELIKTIYKDMPKKLNKADTILYFFNRLLKDNKVKILRELMYKWKI